MAKKTAKLAGHFDPGNVVRIKSLGDESTVIKPGDFAVIVREHADEEDCWYVRNYNADEGSEEEIVYLDEITPSSVQEADDAQVHGDEEVYGGTAPVKLSKKRGKGRPSKQDATTEQEGKEPTAVKPKNTNAKTDKKKGGVLKTAAKKGSAAAAKKSVPKGKAAAKTEKVEAKPEAEPEKEIVFTKSVLDAMRGKDALTAIKDLERKTTMSRWTLGGVLARVKKEKLYASIKSPSTKKNYEDNMAGFSLFLEEQVTGTRYRTAMNLIAIYEGLVPLCDDEERLAEISYSKLDMLLDVVDEGNVEKWLAKAEKLTLENLSLEVKKARVEAGNTPKARGKHALTADMTKLPFKLFNDQATTVMKALEKAKKKCEGDNPTDSEALVLICTEWVQLSK